MIRLEYLEYLRSLLRPTFLICSILLAPKAPLWKLSPCGIEFTMIWAKFNRSWQNLRKSLSKHGSTELSRVCFSLVTVWAINTAKWCVSYAAIEFCRIKQEAAILRKVSSNLNVAQLEAVKVMYWDGSGANTLQEQRSEPNAPLNNKCRTINDSTEFEIGTPCVWTKVAACNCC